MLIEMGYSREQAQNACEATHSNLERAIEYLLQSSQSPQPIQPKPQQLQQPQSQSQPEQKSKPQFNDEEVLQGQLVSKAVWLRDEIALKV